MKINGKTIEISQETADNLEKEFSNKIPDIKDGDFKIEDGVCGGYKLKFKGQTILEIFSETSCIDTPNSFKICSLEPDRCFDKYKMVVEHDGIYIRKK